MRIFFLTRLSTCSIFVFLTSVTVYGQNINRFWVLLTDKGPANRCIEKLSQPQKMLSQAALNRRNQNRIPLDESDLPVYETYIQLLQKENARPLYASRWLNAVCVETSALNALFQLPFVREIVPARALTVSGVAQTTGNDLTRFQLEQIGVDNLHAQGFAGQGVRVAVFDSGFPQVKTLSAFQPLRERNGLGAGYDFVAHDDFTLYQNNIDVHGLQVFSVLAAYKPDTFIGAAYKADYLLARSENSTSEKQIEEYNWLKSVEWADSVGVDIINTSLNYTTFDGGIGNYNMQTDLNGKTSIITRAALTAARKGILVVCSAGNAGDGWTKIAPPCDADSILCVGAVNENGVRGSFSGLGPTTDGRIKPDVMARGTSVAHVDLNDALTYGLGTSFSAPLIAGLAACLKSKHPTATAQNLANAIRLSADRAASPDFSYGYGIPNATKADSILAATLSRTEIQKPVYSLRFTHGTEPDFYLSAPVFTKYRFAAYDITGKNIANFENLSTNVVYPLALPSNGFYLLKIEIENKVFTYKYFK